MYDDQITFRVKREYKEKLKKLIEKDNKTISSILRNFIKVYLQDKGEI